MAKNLKDLLTSSSPEKINLLKLLKITIKI